MTLPSWLGDGLTWSMFNPTFWDFNLYFRCTCPTRGTYLNHSMFGKSHVANYIHLITFGKVTYLWKITTFYRWIHYKWAIFNSNLLVQRRVRANYGTAITLFRTCSLMINSFPCHCVPKKFTNHFCSRWPMTLKYKGIRVPQAHWSLVSFLNISLATKVQTVDHLWWICGACGCAYKSFSTEKRCNSARSTKLYGGFLKWGYPKIIHQNGWFWGYLQRAHGGSEIGHRTQQQRKCKSAQLYFHTNGHST